MSCDFLKKLEGEENLGESWRNWENLGGGLL